MRPTDSRDCPWRPSLRPSHSRSPSSSSSHSSSTRSNSQFRSRSCRLPRPSLLLLALALVLSLVLAAALGVCYALWPDSFSGLFGQVVGQLAVFDRFDSFSYDIFDIRAVVYFAAVAGVGLFLTVQTMERRRWAS